VVARNLGPTIQQERIARGLSRARFAELTGVTPRYLARLEKGERPPTLPMAEKCANALGISLSTLIAKVEGSLPHPPIDG